MIIDGESIKRLIDFLHCKLYVENSLNKTTYYSQFKGVQADIFKFLCGLVNHSLEAIPRKDITFFKNSLDEVQADRKSLDRAIREAMFQISGYVAVIDCADRFYHESINDSVVHTYLFGLALMQFFQFEITPIFEVVQVLHDSTQYSFILFGRDRSVAINNVERWGNDCSIIDSYHQIFGSWNDFNAGSYILKDKIIQGAQLTVLVANDLNLKSLLSTNPNSYYNDYQVSAFNKLREYYIGCFNYYLAQFNLPTLISSTLNELAVSEDEGSTSNQFNHNCFT